MARRCNYALISVIVVAWSWQKCSGFDTLGFDIHHRYSDPVKGMLDVHGLPDEGSIEYYATMARRDQLFRGRRSARTTGDATQLTFAAGNETYLLSSLGFLHYANVSVGSPGLSYLVALDTGSDLFWLPCDCIDCAHALQTSSGRVIELNIYSPRASSTSTAVSCNNSFCERPRQCLRGDTCAYHLQYLSSGTSSTGILVEDMLHLITNNNQEKAVDAQITLGCGIEQTGSFLDGAAPNGLFGLGMENISVPSILASKGLAANSFSMCFGVNGTGRISFGDKGRSGQRETPFNVEQPRPTYNVSVTQISVGDNVTDLSLSAVFDTGTSFTYLNEPAYTVLAERFTSQVREKRHTSVTSDSDIPFEYCYDLSANQPTFDTPSVILTMKGGKPFNVTNPIILIVDQDKSMFYCLGLVRSNDINIIGQNFMTGYRIIFDREKMVLAWEESNCYDAKTYNNLPISPSNSNSTTPTSMDPQATSGPTNGPSSHASKSSSSDPHHLNSSILTVVLGFLSLSIHSSTAFSS